MDTRPGFRFATEDDARLILDFIRRLADFEHMSDEVVATEDKIRESLFDKRQAEVVFAVVDGREVGFALFFHNYSTFLGQAGLYLEDLFILQEHRGHGYGKAMLAHLAHIAVERGYGRFEWSCLDWNEPSIDFYLAQGAKPLEDWTMYRLTGDALRKLADAD